MDITIGHWLKRRRKALGMSQADLGRLCKCSSATIRKIEADIRRPSPVLAEQLAKHLHVTAAQSDAFMRDVRAPHTPGASAKPVDSLHLGQTNVSQSPLALFGRQHLISSVRRRIVNDGCRLLTLTGPPGVGKTSVAMHAAWEMLEDFEDGVYFVSLGDVDSVEVMCGKVVQALELDERAGAGTAYQRLSTQLRDKHVLLVLDNLEQIAQCAPHVAQLLNECAWVYVLATSRAPLQVRREKDQPVPLLPTPSADELVFDLEAACRHYPSLALFTERAQAVNPNLIWTPATLAAAGAICRRLDGLPLAIELVAAKCRLFTPRELLARLQEVDETRSDSANMLDLGAGGINDMPVRQQSLRNAIGSSYALLGEDEQRLFRQLSVFEGSFDEDALQAFHGEAAPHRRVPAMLHDLVNKNLVVMRHDRAEQRVFHMLSVVRAYASERLQAHGEWHDTAERHARVFLDWAQAAELAIVSGKHQPWFERLERNADNTRAALAWFYAQPDNDDGPRLATALAQYWLRQEHLDEGKHWLSAFLETAPPASPCRAKLNLGLANILHIQGEAALAKTHYTLGLELSHGQGDPSAVANAKLGLAFLALADGDSTTARVYAAHCEEIGARINSLQCSGYAALLQGEVALLESKLDDACRLMRTSSELLSAAGDQLGTSCAMERLGHIENSIAKHTESGRFLQLVISHSPIYTPNSGCTQA